MTDDLSLQDYSLISQVRDFLKKTNQISWKFNQLEKRYSFDKITSTNSNEYLEAYHVLLEEHFILMMEYAEFLNSKDSLSETLRKTLLNVNVKLEGRNSTT